MTAGWKDVAGGPGPEGAGVGGRHVRRRACCAGLPGAPVILRALGPRLPNAGLARPQVLSLSWILHGELDF